MRSLKKIPLHPFLLPIYAVLSLWVANIDQTAFYTAVKPLVVSLVIALLLFGVTLLITRKMVTAAMLTSLTELLCLYYGHVLDITKQVSIGGFVIGRNRVLVILWLILLIVGVFLIIKNRKRLETANQYVNIFCFLLTAIVLFQIAQYEISVIPAQKKTAVAEQQSSTGPVEVKTNEDSPDVYFILLDAYGRQDQLLEDLDYDNSEFIQQLKDLGFVIPNCTQSNYDSTAFSLSSTLNMNYLDQLDIPWKVNATKYQSYDFIDPISHNLVRQELKKQGYQFISFTQSYRFIDIPDADIYYQSSADEPFYDRLESLNFYYLFQQTTIMRAIRNTDLLSSNKMKFLPDWLLKLVDPNSPQFSLDIYKKYQETEYELQKLSEIPELEGNKFTYAHLLITHHPFVFNPDGSFRNSRGEGADAYRDQVTFADKAMIEVVKNIIKNSKTPPIIILQGDHNYVAGLGQNRILNAYYLPNGGDKLLYPTITPVNTFRLILSHYFGLDYPLIEDKSFYTQNSDTPYILTQAPESCEP